MVPVERALEVVERLAPAALVGAHGLLVPEAAVGEADRGAAVGLLELELDQLPRVLPSQIQVNASRVGGSISV